MSVNGRSVRTLLSCLGGAVTALAVGCSDATDPEAPPGGASGAGGDSAGVAGDSQAGAPAGAGGAPNPCPDAVDDGRLPDPGVHSGRLSVGTDRAIDRDDDYADGSEILYLTGRGIDDALEWKFLVTGGRKSCEWSVLPVPSQWELHGFGTARYGSETRTDEQGIYRRAFEVPAAWAGRRIDVVFEGSMTDTEVRVNGELAGPVHQGAFYRFEYDVTGLVRPGESNAIEVVVSKESANATVNEAERQADYWVFGGIFRPVSLEARPRAAIDRFAVDARADGSIAVDVTLDGIDIDAELSARVFDADMEPVGEAFSTVIAPGATSSRLEARLVGVEPWTAESPTRYRLALDLATSDGARHALRGNFGFRTVEVRTGDGIYVNDTKVVLRGVNRHSFWPDSGRALSARLSLEDVGVLKDMNVNAVRNSHYPADSHFLDYADAHGFYVLDELAGWQSPPYDEVVGRKLVEELVTFNVNHPSILFWDNGNEGGWNTALDGEFARWDPQARAVLHPWATFSGINTDHYENYASTVAILGRSTIFLPTEFLHGLWDGGAGAGLDDYWRAIRASPLGAGGFLWAFIDEGVQLESGGIDVKGNAAPDGIVGPYREREGSFYTIRELWSPVQIPAAELPEDFAGVLELRNEYDFTDLNTVQFDWQLAIFDGPGGSAGRAMLAEGTASTASIPPHSAGSLDLGLTAPHTEADALLLQAHDAAGTLIGEWSWMIGEPATLRERVVSLESGAAAVASEDAASVVVTAAGAEYTFSKETGRLTSVVAGGSPFSLSNGPALSAGEATLEALAVTSEENDVVVSAEYSGDLEFVRWRVLGNGWLGVTYRYTLSGDFDYFGVDFDYPLTKVEGIQWLGRGPHRVWKNRMKGPVHDVFMRDKNDTITGQSWDYPEFEGYFADVYWARLMTTEGPIAFVVDSPDLFLRVFTPRPGSTPQPVPFPAGDISFLHGIPAVGDKFLPAAALGPQGERHTLDATFEATLYLYFGEPPGLP